MSDLQSQILDLKLGESTETFELGGIEDNRVAAAALAGQAQRTLDLFTPDLEPAIYDTAEFLDGVTQLALGHRRAHVRILVRDPATAIARGHRLIERARRLSSAMEIRRPGPDDTDHNDSLLIADGCGVLHRRLAERYDGSLSFHAPRQARELTAHFEELWARAQPDIELKRLYL